MCASYNPPTENITSFNSSLFNQPENTLSQAEADQLYLSKTKTDTSTSALTTFNNAVTIKGDTSVGDATTSSGWLNIKFRTRIYDVNSPFTNFTQLYMIGGNEFVIGPNTYGDKVSVYVKNSIGSQLQKLEISDTTTKILNNCEIGVSGSTYSAGTVFRNGIVMYDLSSPYGNFLSMYPSGNNMAYIMNAGTTTASKHTFTTYNNANTASNPLTLSSASVDVLPNLNLSNRLVYNASSYSFPLASQQIQGYYLKTTGSALATPTYVSNTYISCVTSPTIAIGVWRIDYSVTNSISVGGNITAADTLISATINNSTPVAFTGAQQTTHTTENYSTGDKHIITGSFTYNQSTAGVLYLTINRVFASGSYSWVGELALTRLS